MTLRFAQLADLRARQVDDLPRQPCAQTGRTCADRTEGREPVARHMPGSVGHAQPQEPSHLGAHLAGARPEAR